jgi:hypothetical protein
MWKRLISGGIVPLVPIAVGIVFKLGFIDSVPAQKHYEFMIQNYGRPMWIDLVVASYVLAAGVLLTVSPKISANTRKLLIRVPAGCFVLSIVFVLVLPKFGIDDVIWGVWIPAAIGYVSICWVGFMVTGIEGAKNE